MLYRSLLLLLLLPPMALAAPPVASLRVVDAEGAPVGVFYPSPRYSSGLRENGYVAFTLLNRAYFLHFTPDRGSFGGHIAQYVTPDCSSLPLVPVRDGIAFARPGWTMYVVPPGSPGLRVDIRSWRGSPAQPCTRLERPTPQTVWRTTAQYDLHARFTPPFRLQAVPFP